MDGVLTIVLAGGMGERLQPLTKERSKAAVPFGGKFRLVDFTLSNCINSGLRQIFVLTQYRTGSLHRHIQEGWGISSAGLGDYIYCIPAHIKHGAEWYHGTADAVRQNLDLITGKSADHVLVLSADHVYKMNYRQMLSYHHRHCRTGVTIAAVRARKEQAAGTLGVIEVDQDYRMVGFEEKPAQPKTLPQAPDYALASMGVYLFQLEALKEALRGDEADFGKEVIPKMLGEEANIFVYDFEKENKIEDFVVEVKDGTRSKILVEQTRDSSYWKDVGTIEAYYEASMDLVAVDPTFNLYGEKWPLRTYQAALPPGKCVLGGRVLESIVCDGCIVSGGLVWGSILSPGVIVERDAVVERSIIFDNVVIEPNARIRRAIIDKECRIRAGAAIGFDLEADKRRGGTISDTGIVVVPKGSDIGPV